MKERGYPGKTDLRVIKTREAIKRSFLACLCEHKFEEISIKTITQKAKINRSTFYKHYEDKYDLKNRYADELIGGFVDNLEVTFLEKRILDTDSYYQELKICLEQMREHKEEYLIFWNIRLPDRDVFQEMIEGGAAKLSGHILDGSGIRTEKKKFSGLYTHLFLSTMMTSIRWWFTEGGFVESDEFTWLMLKHMQEGIWPTLKSQETFINQTGRSYGRGPIGQSENK
ncbi:MAG: TetR/AcrR family transcriptional regulator [Eubacterium sp.]|nr:TetR/AcrR family transcriptional regulator [Eubacterium sp.]